MQTLTVVSDGSWDADYNKGFWACYIRTSKTLIQASGVVVQTSKIPPMVGSVAAERYGISRALLIADDLGLHNYRIVLYCDCTPAMDRPIIANTPASQYYAPSVQWREWYDTNIMGMLKKGVTYEIRHVKGHLRKRQWNPLSQEHMMNHWCDTQCRILRQKSRGNLLKPGGMQHYERHPEIRRP